MVTFVAQHSPPQVSLFPTGCHKLRGQRKSHDIVDRSGYFTRRIKRGTSSWCYVYVFWVLIGEEPVRILEEAIAEEKAKRG